MDILFAILAAIGFMAGVAALALSTYSHVSAKCQLGALMAEMRADQRESDSRVERYIDRCVQEAAIEVRAAAQQDAFDLLQNHGMRDEPSTGVNMANFNNFGG